MIFPSTMRKAEKLADDFIGIFGWENAASHVDAIASDLLSLAGFFPDGRSVLEVDDHQAIFEGEMPSIPVAGCRKHVHTL